jgi:hypothetical protein
MSYEHIPEVLLPAGELVKKAVDGELSVPEFVKAYDSFFHYNALDGHEAIEQVDKDQLAKYQHQIAFHEAVQTQVVDQFYAGQPQPVYDDAGRLSEGPALAKLRELAEQHSLVALLAELDP